MRHASFTSSLRVLTVALPLCLAAPVATIHGQSLAEIAQKAKEARDKAEADRAKAASAGASTDNSSTSGKDADKSKTPPAPAAHKVYNDQTLKEVVPPLAEPAPPPAPASTTATPDGATATTPATTATRTDDVVKDETWWRARMTRLRATLQQAQTEYDAKVKLVARLENVRDNVPERGYSVAQAYAAASAELAKARADQDVAAGAVKAAKAAIDAAEEEARVAGVLPGWLR